MNGFCAVSRLLYLAGNKFPAVILRVIAIGALSCSRITVRAANRLVGVSLATIIACCSDTHAANDVEAGKAEDKVVRFSENLNAIRDSEPLFVGEICMYVEGMQINLKFGAEEKSGGRPDPLQTIRFTTEAVNQNLLGGKSEDAIRELHDILDDELKIVERAITLDDERKQKLLMAGRGDIQHFLQRAESLRPEVEKTRTVRPEAMRDTLREMTTSMVQCRDLRPEFRLQQLRYDSLFGKVLRRMVSASEFNRILVEREKIKYPRVPGKHRTHNGRI